MNPRKDVGEYYDRVEGAWEALGCEAEPLSDYPIFEYESDEHGRDTHRAHLLVRILFPDFSDAYLKVDEWLVGRVGHIIRETYAYDLIYQGARIDNWHRHRHHSGEDHNHDGADRHPIKPVHLVEVIKTSMEVLYSGNVSPED